MAVGRDYSEGSKMKKLVLAIRALDVGGAEKQFIELAKYIDKSKFEVTVCSMYGGEQEEIVKNISQIRYVNLQKTGRYDFYMFYKNYTALLKEIQPDVIYSFLGEMNLFSLWCKPKRTKTIWGFRASDKDWSKYGKVAQAVFWLQKKLSSHADKIISNSYASISYHEKHGFDMRRAVVIPNGIDSKKFQRNNEWRERFRAQYHMKEGDVSIGMVARKDPIKGYTIFTKTAKKLLDKYDNLYFFAVGGGSEAIRQECEFILQEYNAKKFFWLDNQNNIENIYSGLDISVSASLGEGFSNSIAEAMSSALACVVTDVGDSALIVDNLGIVIKPNSAENLYHGIVEILNKEYKELGKKGRMRIVENFSIEKMVENTEKEIVACVG